MRVNPQPVSGTTRAFHFSPCGRKCLLDVAGHGLVKGEKWSIGMSHFPSCRNRPEVGHAAGQTECSGNLKPLAVSKNRRAR